MAILEDSREHVPDVVLKVVIAEFVSVEESLDGRVVGIDLFGDVFLDRLEVPGAVEFRLTSIIVLDLVILLEVDLSLDHPRAGPGPDDEVGVLHPEPGAEGAWVGATDADPGSARVDAETLWRLRPHDKIG